MRLDDVRGFVFDVDGTLVDRFPDGPRPLPGAVEVLTAIRASGRPLALFTNATNVTPEAFAEELRDAGLPVDDEEMVTPVRSALSHVLRRHADRSVLLFAEDPVRAFLVDAGLRLADPDDPAPDVVLVLHPAAVDFSAMERAARAISDGARFLTANILPAYAGANGPIISRGAMLTAAIAKAAGRRATVVGKPSRAAVQELRDRLGVPSEDLLVTGDDVRMDVALGHAGGARTVLVRTGLTTDVEGIPAARRPHAIVDSVADLLPWL
jgi:HAD superfamily hydrolase (TIGR01450 family)